MVDVVADPGERAAQSLWHMRRTHRGTAHVELVDDEIAGAVARPARHRRAGAVTPENTERRAAERFNTLNPRPVTVVLRREPHLPRFGVEQKLRRIEAGRCTAGAIDPESVQVRCAEDLGRDLGRPYVALAHHRDCCNRYERIVAIDDQNGRRRCLRAPQ